jgi:hypothetical protein
MATCELCLNPKRQTRRYPAQLLDGSRDEVVLCATCREAFRRGTSMAPTVASVRPGCTGNDDLSRRGSRPTYQAQDAESGRPDWHAVVYGGRPARR